MGEYYIWSSWSTIWRKPVFKNNPIDWDGKLKSYMALYCCCCTMTIIFLNWCEKFNSTLINMLGVLLEKSKSMWRDSEGTLVHTYNCTHNNATKLSPYYLMFGRKQKWPIDLCFGTNTMDLTANTSAVPNLYTG